MKIGIAGCSGRMGKSLLSYGLQEQAKGKCVIAGATVKPESEYENQYVEVLLGTDFKSDLKTVSSLENLNNLDAIIDFTTPKYTMFISEFCNRHKIIHVCGTTGFTSEQKYKLELSAKTYPLLYSANMSYGMSMIMSILGQLSNNLNPEDYDVDIIEKHHRKKVDTPSGTALMIAEQISSSSNRPNINLPGSVSGRKIGDVSISSIRSANLSGSHEIIFASNSEVLTLKHESCSRFAYSEGAFKACYWMKNKPFGKVYSMLDVVS